MIRPVSRRQFLAGAGAAAAAAGCSRGGEGGSEPAGELDTVARLAGLEQLLADTYDTAVGISMDGRLGAVEPPAVTELVRRAGAHHRDHLAAWNRVLTAAGRHEVTHADPKLRARVDTAVGRVVDVPGLATFALRLEDYAARTYLQAVASLTDAEVVRTAAQIAVVDQQHQAVLRYVLGLPPVGSGAAGDTADVAPADPRFDLLP